MSTRAKAAALIASAGVLFAGWQLGTANGATVAATPTSETTTSGPSATPSTSSSPSSTQSNTTPTPSPTSATKTTSGATGTYTGDTFTNRYGSITVTVKLVNGKITDVTASAQADDHHSEEINSRAVPVLRSEVIAANSAEVDSVGGATYTTQSYLSSLQSALDKA